MYNWCNNALIPYFYISSELQHCCMPKRNVGQASQEQEPQQSNSDTADRLATTTYISQGAVPLDVQEPAYLLQCINQPPASGNTKEFPVRTLKVLGSVQIGLGIVLGVWSIVGVILDVISMLKECKQYDVDILYNFPAPNYLCKNWAANSYKVFAFDITCLVFSGWYVLTGFLPLRMSRKIESSSDGLRVGYMVCSIIGASILAPTMFILGVVGAIMREGYEKDVIVLSAFMAVLSFAELVVSIIGASYCCCCIPWKETYQSIRVVYAPHPVMICNLPQSQIPTTTDQPNRLNAVGQSDNQIVQYPRTQQYHVIATNTLLTSPIQPAASA